MTAATRCRYWGLALLFFSTFVIPVSAWSVIRFVYVEAYYRMPFGDHVDKDSARLGLANIAYEITDNQLIFFQVMMDNQVVVESTPALLTFINGAIQNNWGDHMLSLPGELRWRRPRVNFTELTIYTMTGWDPLETHNLSHDTAIVTPREAGKRVYHHRIYRSEQGRKGMRLFGATTLKNDLSIIGNLVLISFGNYDLVLALKGALVTNLQSPKYERPDQDDKHFDGDGSSGSASALFHLSQPENETAIMNALTSSYGHKENSWEMFVQGLLDQITLKEFMGGSLDR